MPARWIATGYTITPLGSGFLIVLLTDVSAHLWMRWTLIVPQEHLVSVMKRGLADRKQKYFCFDSFVDNEQLERGDTLVHTFYKPDWPLCQTRYFYFWGTIAGLRSPSETAKLSYHSFWAEPLPGHTLLNHEQWTWLRIDPPPHAAGFYEPWYWQGFAFPKPANFVTLITELWDKNYPGSSLLLTEVWTWLGISPPALTQLTAEPWTS